MLGESFVVNYSFLVVGRCRRVVTGIWEIEVLYYLEWRFREVRFCSYVRLFFGFFRCSFLIFLFWVMLFCVWVASLV